MFNPTLVKKYPFCSAILAITALFYTITGLNVGFLGDDWRYLYEIQKTANPFNLILHPYTTTFAWRPLTDLSWVLNYIISGTNPIGYHLVSFGIFFATLAALFITLRRITQERIAIWATTLFAIMPIHNESILWLSGRTDSLALLFFLLSFYYFILFRTVEARQNRNLIFSVLFFAVSIFCKESAILAPIIFLVTSRYILEAKAQSFKNDCIALSPYLACIIALLALRFLVLGNLVSDSTTFNDQYSVIPTLASITSTIRAATFVFNRSTAVATFPDITFVWKMLLLPASCIYILALIILQKPWKNAEQRKVLILGINMAVCFILPVLSLLNHITPDLQGIRFLYAPSLGVAIMLAAIFSGVQSRQLTRVIQYAGFGGGIAVAAVASLYNIHPWLAATQQSQTFVEQLAYQYPEYTQSTAQTTVYMLHTPTLYRGAYLFHDYYSLQQAVKQYTHNPLITVQSAGTEQAFPAPYCGDTLPTNVHVLSWNGESFEDQDNFLVQTKTDTQSATPFSLQSEKTWTDAEIKTHDLSFHFDSNALVIEHFSEHPQIQITLPNGSASHDFRTLSLKTNAKKPILLSWNTPQAESPTFQSISVDPSTSDQLIPLCAFPNWVMAGGIQSIVLTFSPDDTEPITITSLELK